MKTSCYKTVLLLACWLFAAANLTAQSTNFQRLYGTDLKNSFTKTLRSGTNYYVLGRDEPTAGALNRAIVTRLNAQGQHQWTLRLDIASQWNDAVVTPNGNLLLVGNTLPFDANCQSLAAVVTAAGAFSWVRSYNVPGRETFNRVVRNPSPDNGAFPYYILGIQWDPAGNANWDDVVLLTASEAGNFGWKKVYSGLFGTTDDEFVRDLEALPNGDLILAGNLGTGGVVFRADNTGAIYNAAGPDGLSFTFADVAQTSGGFLAVGNTVPSVSAFLMKFDSDLLVQWQINLPDLTAISQVWRDGDDGIYVTGRATVAGLNRGVVLKFQDSGNDPAPLLWMKYLDNAEAAYTGGSSWYLPPSQLAFTDGRSRNTSEDRAFLSVSDLDMSTCMTQEGFVSTVSADLSFNAPVPPDIEFADVLMGTNVTVSSAVDWGEEDACSAAPPELSCGDIRVQVEPGQNGRAVYYDWLSAEGNLVALTCNPASGSFFPVGATPVVCTATDVNGLTDECAFTVTVEQMPFDSLQPPPNFSPDGSLDRVRDRLGNPYNLRDLQVPGNPATFALCTNSGYFNLYFEPGCGMDGNSPTEIARRDVLCQLFADLSNFIDQPNPSSPAMVNIWVRDISQVPGVPNPTTAGILGLATSFYVLPSGLPAFGGIVEGEIWKTINSGVDSYTGVSAPLIGVGSAGAGFYHGMVAFNFVNPGINWHTSLPTTTGASLYDLYSVGLHEAVHALGFASLIRTSGQSAFGPPFSNYYSRYDTYLQTMNNLPLITNTGSCVQYNYQFNPALSLGVLQPNPSSCITNQTTCAAALKFAGSVQQKVYTPNCFESGSSLSHLEDQCHAPSPYPNDQYYVMSNANGSGSTYMKRFLKPEERQVLCDLGYKVGMTYGNSSQMTFANYSGGACPGLGVAGVNDGITSVGTFAYITNVSTPITVNNVLANDFQAASFECLQVLLGGGSVNTTVGTSFIYTPTANPGTTLLRYTPVSASGERGNITYVFIRVQRAGCTANPCRLLGDSGFEQSSGCGGVDNSISNPNAAKVFCWDNLSSSPDLFARTGCIQSTYTFPNSSNPDVWDAPTTTNNYYIGLWATKTTSLEDYESTQTTLATPITQGNTYTISFWARMRFPTNGPTNIYIAGSPATLAPGGSAFTPFISLSTPLLPCTAMPVPNNGAWNFVSCTFTYTNATPLYNLIVANYPGNTPFSGLKYVYIDDVQIIPHAAQPTLAIPSPICDNAAPISLNATATPPGGIFTGTGVSGAYSFDPATAGIGAHVITYTVTDINGCTASATATIQVDPCIPVCDITNRCLDFDGIDDFVDVVNPLNTGTLQNNFTVACWFRNDRTAGAFFYRLFGFAWNGPRFEVGDQNGFLTLFINPGTGTVLSTVNIRDGLWHHLVAVKSGTAVTIYLDCVPVITLPSEGIFAGAPQNFHLGDWAGGGAIPRFWQGQIDEFKVWGAALTAAEIRDEMFCSLDPSNANLLIHFPFDQGIPGGNNSSVGAFINVGSAGGLGLPTNFLLNTNSSNLVARGRDLLPDCNVNYFAWLEGNPRRNISRRTKVYEADIFTAGVEVINNAAYPIFTRRRSDGNIVWRTVIDLPGAINDFVRTDGGCYLLVGHTPVFGGNNRSFTALIDHTGALQWLHRHDLGERESFVRIIRSDNPSDPLFPYVVCGIRKNAGTSRDDILLFTLNDQGTIDWMNQIGNVGTDDEFRFDLMNHAGGYLLTGFYINGGTLRPVLFHTDNLGVQTPSTEYQPNIIFYDIEPAATGSDIFIAGQLTSGDALLAKVTATGTPVWALRFPSLTVFRKLLVQPKSNDIYVVGQRDATGQYRNVIVKVQDGPGGPAVVWQKHAELPSQGENNWTPLDLVWYSGKMFFFTDGRINHANGWGNEDVGAVMYDLDRINDTCPVMKEMPAFQDMSLVPAPMPVLSNVSVIPSPPLVSNPWYSIGMERDTLCADRCECKFTKMWFRKKGHPISSWVVSVPDCDLPPATLPGCPGQTTPIYFSGLLQCQGDCMFNGLNWTLTDPNGSSVSGISATAAFTIPITLSMVQVPGIYTLVLTGKCGNETCTCTVRFIVPACPKPCDCSEPAFTNTVNAGFNWLQLPGCKFNFTPKNLTDCDQVVWQVALSGSSVFTTFASSVGNQTVSYTFPATDQYVVCWTVTRTPPGGTPCTKSRCWTFDVDCSLLRNPDDDLPDFDACMGSVVENGGFTIGAEAGGLAEEGTAWNWDYSGGNPEVVLEMGKADTNFVRLRGNGRFADLLYQDTLTLGAERIHLSMAFRPIPALLLPGTELVVRVSGERQDSLFCNDENTCQEILRIPVPDATDAIWLLAGSYDSTVFNGRYLTIHVENPFVDDDVAVKSVVDIDNICIRQFNFVDTDEPAYAPLDIRLYPNPTSGYLNIRAHQPLSEKAQLRLFDIRGQLLRETMLEKGVTAHALNLNMLPAGLYIVEIQSGAGKVWRGKVVKQ